MGTAKSNEIFKLKEFFYSLGFTKFYTYNQFYLFSFILKPKYNPFDRKDSYLFVNKNLNLGISINFIEKKLKILDLRSTKQLMNIFNEDKESELFYEDEVAERLIFEYSINSINDIKDYICNKLNPYFLILDKVKLNLTLEEVYNPYKEFGGILKIENNKFLIKEHIYGLRSTSPSYDYNFSDDEYDIHSHPYFGDYDKKRDYNYPSLADLISFLGSIFDKECFKFSIASPSSIICFEFNKKNYNSQKIEKIINYLEELSDDNIPNNKKLNKFFIKNFNDYTLSDTYRLFKRLGFNLTLYSNPIIKTFEDKNLVKELRSSHNSLKRIIRKANKEKISLNLI